MSFSRDRARIFVLRTLVNKNVGSVCPVQLQLPHPWSKHRSSHANKRIQRQRYHKIMQICGYFSASARRERAWEEKRTTVDEPKKN
jgi:hypothetical protein